jgi:hypothetical protein
MIGLSNSRFQPVPTGGFCTARSEHVTNPDRVNWSVAHEVDGYHPSNRLMGAKWMLFFTAIALLYGLVKFAR